jgi:hypothetical protein
MIATPGKIGRALWDYFWAEPGSVSKSELVAHLVLLEEKAHRALHGGVALNTTERYLLGLAYPEFWVDEDTPEDHWAASESRDRILRQLGLPEHLPVLVENVFRRQRGEEPIPVR